MRVMMQKAGDCRMTLEMEKEITVVAVVGDDYLQEKVVEDILITVLWYSSAFDARDIMLGSEVRMGDLESKCHTELCEDHIPQTVGFSAVLGSSNPCWTEC